MNAEADLEARKRLFRQKLEANSQRNSRRNYLASLPNDLRGYLSECLFLPIADFEAVAPQFRITVDGFGKPPVKPQSYRFREFAWRHKVVREVQKLDGRHDAQPAFFWLPDAGPIYQVEFGWVRKNLALLLNYRLGVITLDKRAGMVVDDYCGYVDGDLNPDEEVYELAFWGFD